MHIRDVTGKTRIHRISPVELLEIASGKSSRTKFETDGDLVLNPDFIRGIREVSCVDDLSVGCLTGQVLSHRDSSGLKRNLANVTTAAATPPLTASNKPKKPKAKERLAYIIELTVKWAYPGCFILFNASYWSFYLKDYHVTAEL